MIRNKLTGEGVPEQSLSFETRAVGDGDLADLQFPEGIDRCSNPFIRGVHKMSSSDDGIYREPGFRGCPVQHVYNAGVGAA